MSQPNYKPLPRLTTDTIKRFWDNVDRRAPNECWHWTGMLVNSYGVMYVGGEMYYAIRILHTIMNGVDPGDAMIRHTCDVPSCCNFLHHVPGSHQQNTQDAIERGRFASGARNAAHAHPESRPRGEDQGNSKLTEADVIRMRERYAAGETCHMIAKDYPVNQNTVQQIIKGNRWAHVGGPVVDGDLSRAGERSGHSRLTEEQVLEILKKRSEGVTIMALCREYQVTQGAITAIIYGKSWQHLGALAQAPKKQMERDQVVEIRRLHKSGRTLDSLAKEFGTSRSNIHNIVKRITWPEVE